MKYNTNSEKRILLIAAYWGKVSDRDIQNESTYSRDLSVRRIVKPSL